MQIFSRFGITKTITATTVMILIAALGAVAWVISGSIETRIQEQAIAGQDASLRTAATIIERDLPGTKVTWAKDGNVERIVMEAIPKEFTEHSMIDTIGRMTGQTATIFAWDTESKDFWRRTTNIIKPDGNRAVGTALGQTGAVYPFAVKGQVYRGEAVILETPYYTIYQPIFSPAGDVLGILYAGVRKADINSIATEMTYAIGTTALIVLLIAATLVALLVRRIVGSLPRLTAVADRLASGQLETSVPDQDLHNEIGALARSINVFRESAIQKIEIERRAAEAAAQGDQERAERERAKAEDARLVQEAVDVLAGCLNRLSDGDLTVRIDRAFTGNLDRLRVDFNAPSKSSAPRSPKSVRKPPASRRVPPKCARQPTTSPSAPNSRQPRSRKPPQPSSRSPRPSAAPPPRPTKPPPWQPRPAIAPRTPARLSLTPSRP